MRALLAVILFAAPGAFADCEPSLLGLPLVAQETDYTCGPACVRSVVRYFFGEDPTESELAASLETDDDVGTLPEAIVRHLRARGLNAAVSEETSLRRLTAFLAAGEALIAGVTFEAEPHYVLVRGLNDGRVELMDPMHARAGRFRRLSVDQFLKIWRFEQGGIVSERLLLRVSHDSLTPPSR